MTITLILKYPSTKIYGLDKKGSNFANSCYEMNLLGSLQAADPCRPNINVTSDIASYFFQYVSVSAPYNSPMTFFGGQFYLRRTFLPLGVQLRGDFRSGAVD